MKILSIAFSLLILIGAARVFAAAGEEVTVSSDTMSDSWTTLVVYRQACDLPPLTERCKIWVAGKTSGGDLVPASTTTAYIFPSPQKAELMGYAVEQGSSKLCTFYLSDLMAAEDDGFRFKSKTFTTTCIGGT